MKYQAWKWWIVIWAGLLLSFLEVRASCVEVADHLLIKAAKKNLINRIFTITVDSEDDEAPIVNLAEIIDESIQRMSWRRQKYFVIDRQAVSVEENITPIPYWWMKISGADHSSLQFVAVPTTQPNLVIFACRLDSGTDSKHFLQLERVLSRLLTDMFAVGLEITPQSTAKLAPQGSGNVRNLETRLDVANFFWELRSADRNYPFVFVRDLNLSKEPLGEGKTMVDLDLVLSAFAQTAAIIYHLRPKSAAEEWLQKLAPPADYLPPVGGIKILDIPLPLAEEQPNRKFYTSWQLAGRLLWGLFRIGN